MTSFQNGGKNVFLSDSKAIFLGYVVHLKTIIAARFEVFFRLTHTTVTKYAYTNEHVTHFNMEAMMAVIIGIFSGMFVE